MKKKIILSRAEVKWLKGFSEDELEGYMHEFPIREETTREFQRRYKYIDNKWKRK